MQLFKLAPVALVSLTAVACSGPSQWGQFHADGPNRGFVSVHSGKAVSAKWSADVGPVLFSSPALDLDGVIYIGNLNGELVAVNPDGSPKWRFQAPFADRPLIYSSPAISSSRLIYFIVNHGVTDKSAANDPGESVLFGLDTLKNVRCTFPFPPGSVTTSSPKVFTSGNTINVFVAGIEGSPSAAALRVFDQECHPVAKQIWDCPHDVVGGALDWDFVLSLFTGGLYAIFHPFEFRVAPLPYPLFDPSPAIVDSPAEPGKVIVVAGVTACGLHTFAWDPSTVLLTPKWFAPNARNSISSPAVSPSRDQVVVGQDDGHVLAFDLRTGKLLWDYDAGESVMATPAFFSSAWQVYVASDTHIHKIDNDGTLIRKVNFSRTLSSAAMTLDHMYISSDSGLRTLGYDLSIESEDGGASHGGSSPIVSPDGTVFAVGTDRLLHAYP